MEAITEGELVKETAFDIRRVGGVGVGLLMIVVLTACGSAAPSSAPPALPKTILPLAGEDRPKTAALQNYLKERYGAPGNQAAWYPHITKVFVANYASIDTDYEQNASTDSLIRELCQRVLEFDSLPSVQVYDRAGGVAWSCHRTNE